MSENNYNYEEEKKKVLEKKIRAQKTVVETKTETEKKPDWFKVKFPSGENYQETKAELRKNNLWTVCEEASCPNIGECWAAKTATIMILGGTCTRACKFCHVDTGNPGGKLDLNEITNAAKMAKVMALKYLVVTSVDRDDLADFGASHFANVVEAIRESRPETLVEVLIPDFNGVEEHMHTLAKSNPFVIAQNVETVKRLTHPVRDRRAGYEQTLKCLEFYKKNYPHISTKTSLMVGLGETVEEIIETMKDLRAIDVDIITFGQYLRPTQRHLPVVEYYKPAVFEELKEKAYEMGFKFVASGPLVRSSYKAADYMDHLKNLGHLK